MSDTLLLHKNQQADHQNTHSSLSNASSSPAPVAVQRTVDESLERSQYDSSALQLKMDEEMEKIQAKRDQEIQPWKPSVHTKTTYSGPAQFKIDSFCPPAKVEGENNTAQFKNSDKQPWKPSVQRKEGPAVQNVSSGSGNKMDTALQAKMEGSFGTDFSDVNIHKNSDKAPALNALAYTQGTDIHFAPGQYNPESQKGQELIGHELTHVVQQKQGRVQSTTQSKGVGINDDTRLEKEADDMGRKAAEGKTVHGSEEKFSANSISSTSIQKKESAELNYSEIAKAIHTAIEGIGTDEEAVYAALKKLNNNGEHIKKLTETYLKQYNTSLLEDIEGDFSGSELHKVKSLITPINIKEAAGTKVETAKPESAIAEVRKPVEEVVPTISNALSIESLVGEKKDNAKKGIKYNLGPDVRVVQDQLYALGYLSKNDYQKELADASKKEEIAKDKLTLTIQAIKKFQTEVRQSSTPDGLLSPTGNDIQYLATAFGKPDKDSVDQIKKAREEFKVSYVSGEEELSGGLSKPVGNTNGNIPKELSNIQSRLVELGYLKTADLTDKVDKKTKKVTSPGEKPEQVKTFYSEQYLEGKGDIKAAHIPLTIKAIKQFQKSKVKYWISKNLLASKEFTEGVINLNDASFIVLRDYKKYTVTYKGVDNQEKTKTFSNFPKSSDTVYTEGVSYAGDQNSLVTSPTELASLGLDATYSKIVFFISTHEGKFDAINSYDKAVFSYGFIQYAGGEGRGLRPLLAYLKSQKPDVFKERFQNYGIDAEYSVDKDGKITKANITVISEKGEVLRNDAAEKYIRQSIDLHGVFLKASEDKEVHKMQIFAAYKNYVGLAKSFKLDISKEVLHILNEDKTTIKETYVGADATKYKKDKKVEYDNMVSEKRVKIEQLIINEKAEEYLSSEKGLAAILNIAINQGNKFPIQNGISDLIESKNIKTKVELKNFDIIEKLKSIKNKVFKPDRIQSIIDSKELSGS